MAVSSLPTSRNIEPDLLELFGDEKEWRLRDIRDVLADRYSLTPEQLAEEVPSGQQRFYHRCHRAKQELGLANLVESPRRLYWKITQRGLDVLSGKEPPPRHWHNWKPPKRG